MPNKDGTGPNGQGGKTGRGMGNCDTIESNEETDKDIDTKKSSINSNQTGRGQGKGFGGGKGMGRGKKT